ncbi:MAG: hypothetical protein ACOC2Y_00895 [Spirochaetota bacterium]
MNTKAYAILLAVTVLATLGGLLTLVPAPGASYPNLLGYRSLCTFAPAATLYCFAIAGASCVLRASLVKRKAFTGRASFRAPAIVVVALVLALGLASTGWFIAVKSHYPDGESSATVTRRP